MKIGYYMHYPTLLGDFRRNYPYIQAQGLGLQSDRARLDLNTKVSVHGVNRGCQVFLAVFYYRRSRGKLTLFRGQLGIFGYH